MAFGFWRKYLDASAEPTVWTMMNARKRHRDKAGRIDQRRRSKTFRQDLQARHNAMYVLCYYDQTLTTIHSHFAMANTNHDALAFCYGQH